MVFSVMNLSEFADLITLVCFAITIWQLIVVRNDVKRAVERINKTQILVQVTDGIRLAELIQTNLQQGEWNLSMFRLRELNKILLDLRSDVSLLQQARETFPNAMSSVASNLDYLYKLATGGENNSDVRFIVNNLQQIQDNLTLIKNFLKK